MPAYRDRFGWSRIAIAVAAAWIALAFACSLLAKVRWLDPKDFDFATAMKYHGFMVPLWVMGLLLAGRLFRVAAARGRLFALLAILAVLLSGPASFANAAPGLSLAGALQIGGMTLADLLGVILLLALLRKVRRGPEREDAVFWLFVCSLAGVLAASLCGHLAGWGADLGLRTFPGLSALLAAEGMQVQTLQEAVLTSHSHLIVVAACTGLVALAARMFGYRTLGGLKRRIGLGAVWLIVLGLGSVLAIYAAGTLTGWEPPALFPSGRNAENGVPLDDIALSLCELGWVVLLLVSAFGEPDRVWKRAHRGLVRASVFLNVIAGFLGVVALGLYVELHETFFGGGELPAPGARNDRAFLRAHLLFPLFLLPLLLGFVLATASDKAPPHRTRRRDAAFLWLSMIGMAAGLAGEYRWVGSLDRAGMPAAMILVGAALLLGAGTLLRRPAR